MGNNEIIENENDDELIVTLTLDDDVTMDCQVVTVFNVEDQEYIALLPMEGPEKDTGNVYLYRYTANGDDEPELENIEDDDEYERASDAFDEYLDSVEFDELVTEEDEDE